VWDFKAWAKYGTNTQQAHASAREERGAQL